MRTLILLAFLPAFAWAQNTITPERVIIHGAPAMGFMPTDAANVQSVRNMDGATTNLNALFGVTAGQDMPNSGPQGIEGYVYTYQSGLTTLAIGTMGHAQHAGSGTTTNMRGVQGGVYITGSGGGTHAAGFYTGSGRIGNNATGTYTNGYGLFVDNFLPGFTNRYGVYVKDATADNYFAGSVTIGNWTLFDDNGTLKAKNKAGSVRILANP